MNDTGCGIDPSLRSQLFQPYFSTKRKGVGLGLAIVQKIIEDHHGVIRSVDKQSQGMCFIIELPIHHQELLEDAHDIQFIVPKKMLNTELGEA